MEIKLKTNESEEYFYNAMCNGLGYISGYGLKLQINKESYQKAKANLLKKDSSSPCYEDVLIQVLKDGGELKFVDEECDGEYTRSITLKDVHERVQLTPAEHLLDMINENDDATTADVILQTVIYNEVIFG